MRLVSHLKIVLQQHSQIVENNAY